MKTLGISVYPDLRPLDEIKDYFKLAAKYGCSRVFSSMFNIEGTPDEVTAYFRDLIKEAHKYGMRVSLDVNPEFLERIGVTPTDISLFKDIQCDIIRMDGCYGDDRDIALINNPYGIQIEFNTSMAQASIMPLIEAGADPKRILTCHNFYPQPYTGMEWEKFKATNKEIKEKSELTIAAFVSSNAPHTHGVWDAQYGLPTVEKMRHYPIDLQARLLLATDNVDDILIGNAYATEEEFVALHEVLLEESERKDHKVPAFVSGFLPEGVLEHPRYIKVKADPNATEYEKDILFNFFPHVDLGDSSEWIWRSRAPRMFVKDNKIQPRDPGKDTFEFGDVIMVNDNYRHYAGEVQVVLVPMKNDGMRNLIGHIEFPENEMLELVKEHDVVVFQEQE